MKIEEWNKLPKDSETDVIAVEGDLVTLIDGIAFLIQRKNNWNNIVCIRVSPSNRSLVRTFEDFRKFCEENKIQYIRVEGSNRRTYKMLFLVSRLSDVSNVIYERTESALYKRNIYYVKTY